MPGLRATVGGAGALAADSLSACALTRAIARCAFAIWINLVLSAGAVLREALRGLCEIWRCWCALGFVTAVIADDIAELAGCRRTFFGMEPHRGAVQRFN